LSFAHLSEFSSAVDLLQPARPQVTSLPLASAAEKRNSPEGLIT
jgi:hypothetical protein